jgi:plastocyanin
MLPRAPAFAALLLLAAPLAPVEAKPKARVHRVEMQGMVFVPAKLTVRRGDTVVFDNVDLVPHTATAGPEAVAAFDSGVLPAGSSFKWVAEKRGAYPYLCKLHPGMVGALTVK